MNITMNQIKHDEIMDLELGRVLVTTYNFTIEFGFGRFQEIYHPMGPARPGMPTSYKMTSFTEYENAAHHISMRESKSLLPSLSSCEGSVKQQKVAVRQTEIRRK
jgi:hypothetical protein